jgi:uncharacterized protein YbaR (Trm112 family)
MSTTVEYTPASAHDFISYYRNHYPQQTKPVTLTLPIVVCPRCHDALIPLPCCDLSIELLCRKCMQIYRHPLVDTILCMDTDNSKPSSSGVLKVNVVENKETQDA